MGSVFESLSKEKPAPEPGGNAESSKESSVEKKVPQMKFVPKATVYSEEFLAEEIWDRKRSPRYCGRSFKTGQLWVRDSLSSGRFDAKGNLLMYVPIDNPALRKGLVIVPSEPKQTTFREMLEKADVFSKQCYDPGDQELKVRLLARIVIGSWFLDRFVREPELDIAGSGKYAPIIPIRGPSQSGKNRLAFVLRLLSYRPFFEMST